jgi:DDE superfamily endonuclease
MIAEKLDARRLVFVDEMGTNTALSPLYAWAPRGRRAHCSVPRNRGKNTTLLASMSAEGMGPTLAVEGATNREVFEAYVERVLAPTLLPGQVVVMDNLSAQGAQGQGADREEEMRTDLPAALLARPQPYRRGFLED